MSSIRKLGVSSGTILVLNPLLLLLGLSNVGRPFQRIGFSLQCNRIFFDHIIASLESHALNP